MSPGRDMRTDAQGQRACPVLPDRALDLRPSQVRDRRSRTGAQPDEIECQARTAQLDHTARRIGQRLRCGIDDVRSVTRIAHLLEGWARVALKENQQIVGNRLTLGRAQLIGHALLPSRRPLVDPALRLPGERVEGQ